MGMVVSTTTAIDMYRASMSVSINKNDAKGYEIETYIETINGQWMEATYYDQANIGYYEVNGVPIFIKDDGVGRYHQYFMVYLNTDTWFLYNISNSRHNSLEQILRNKLPLAKGYAGQKSCSPEDVPINSWSFLTKTNSFGAGKISILYMPHNYYTNGRNNTCKQTDCNNNQQLICNQNGVCTTTNPRNRLNNRLNNRRNNRRNNNRLCNTGCNETIICNQNGVCVTNNQRNRRNRRNNRSNKNQSEDILVLL